jgi:hypothetical protein
MLSYVLQNIIECEFDRHCGPEEEKRFGKYERRKYGLQIDFSFSKNEVVNLLIYGEYNYVGVYVKETMESEWGVEGYHDSCWRQSLGTWLFNNRDEIESIHRWVAKSIKREPWYKIVEPTDEEVKALKKARDKRYG